VPVALYEARSARVLTPAHMPLRRRQSIARHRNLPDAIPWFDGGHTDPWDSRTRMRWRSPRRSDGTGA